jgi:3-oxoacyl-[acyl-carrier protein] reductase
LRDAGGQAHAFGQMQAGERMAVITGGSGTLGAAIAQRLRDEGWHVDAPGRSVLDVRDELAVREFFEKRAPELLVCAAGITRDMPLARMSEGVWDEVWDVNFRSAELCADAVLPGMAARGRGQVIFISSFSAISPPAGQAAYAAAKAALLGLTRDLARRHGHANVRINVILPGFIESRMTAGVSSGRRTQVLDAHSLGRFNTAREVAAFVRFLHDELPHTSGQVFQLDSRPPA